MKLCTSALSRKDGITFYGRHYKVEMNEKKDGTIEYVKSKLPFVEQKSVKKFSSVPFIRGLVSFARFTPLLILWIISIILSIYTSVQMVSEEYTTSSSWYVLFLWAILVIEILIMVILIRKLYGKNTFLYHGAEHKIIHVLDKDLELTLENIRLQPRYHKNCGSVFAVFFLLVDIIFSLLPLDASVLLPITYAISYELFCIKNGENLPVIRYFYKVGKVLQEKFTTKEPTDEMILNSIVAINILIGLEEEAIKNS